MTKEEVLEKLTEIFRDTFDDESIVLTSETNSNDIEEWDSLTHISIIVCVEEMFNIKFDISEATEMKDVGEMIDKIVGKIS